MDTPAVSVRERLEATFRHIHEQRMQAMALCNPALAVEALGFGDLPESTGRLGVLITPWSMNLILLPAGEALPAGRVGRRALPAGEVEFVGSREGAFGPFEACSLFSPVLHFPDQLTARAVANETLGVMLGELPAAEQAGGSTRADRSGPPGGGRNSDSAVDRRRFLRGAWARGKR